MYLVLILGHIGFEKNKYCIPYLNAIKKSDWCTPIGLINLKSKIVTEPKR